MLEPDYEGLRKFQPVIDKFKDIFYDGAAEDPSIGEKPKRVGGAGRGRGRGAGGSAGASQSSVAGRGRGRAAAGKKRDVEVVGQFIGESDSEDEKKPIVPKSKKMKVESELG